MRCGQVRRGSRWQSRELSFTCFLCRAGMVGFLTICYIIAVNPAILSDTGGTCR
jgi:hypothetical protein